MANSDRCIFSLRLKNELAHKIEALVHLYVMSRDELIAHLLDIGFKHKPEGDALAALTGSRPLKEGSDGLDYTYKMISVEKMSYVKIKDWCKSIGVDRNIAFGAILSAGIAHTHLVSFEDQIKKKEEAYWKRTLGAPLFKKMEAYAKKRKTTLAGASEELFLKAAKKSNKEQVKMMIGKGLAVK